MNNWKASDVEKITKQKLKPRSLGVKIPTPTPTGLQYIKNYLTSIDISFTTEHKFHSKRRYRFDLAIPDLKIAIEYEGLMSRKSRHTTISGYSEDTSKYNLATIEGWRVLRYTAINYKNLSTDLKQLISKQ